MLASSNISSEWIEESKRILFEVCPKTSKLNEAGENIPRFVSHYLDELPPIGFGSMDTSSLLTKLEQLGWEVLDMRKVCKEQVQISENLCKVTEGIEQRVAVIKKAQSFSSPVSGECESCDGIALTQDHSAEITRPAETQALTREWSTVVKEGRRVKHVPEATADFATRRAPV